MTCIFITDDSNTNRYHSLTGTFCNQASFSCKGPTHYKKGHFIRLPKKGMGNIFVSEKISLMKKVFLSNLILPPPNGVGNSSLWGATLANSVAAKMPTPLQTFEIQIAKYICPNCKISISQLQDTFFVKTLANSVANMSPLL